MKVIRANRHLKLEASIAGKPRRFKIEAYDGGPLPVDGFDLPVIVDLATVSYPESIPILIDHDATVEATLGSTDLIENNGQTLNMAGIVTATSDLALKVVAQSDKGQRWQASIGVRIGDLQEIRAGHLVVVNGQTFRGPVFVARNSQMFETSVLPAGADWTTKVNLAASAANSPKGKIMGPMGSFDEWIVSLGIDATTLGETDKAALTLAYDAAQNPNPTQPTIVPAATPAAAPVATAAPVSAPVVSAGAVATLQAKIEGDMLASMRQKHADELERQRMLAGVASKYPLILAAAIREGWDAIKTENACMKEDIKARAPAGHVHSHDTNCSEQALAYGLMHRTGVRLFSPTLSAAAKVEAERHAEMGHRYRNVSLTDICRESLRLSGKDCPIDRDEVIRAAFSTQALTNIFTNSVNAKLLATYDESPDSTDGWVSEEDVPDFKANDRIALGQGSSLERLPRGKEAAHATRSDSVESYRVYRYAKQFVVDEQDIVDDRLSALMTMPEQMGMAARRLRPDLVYSLLLANAALVDTVALFHATHANLGTGAGSVLASTGLTAAMLAMAKQTEGGVNLNLSGQFLVVPHDLRFVAQALLRSAELRDTTASTKYPTYNVIQDLNLSLRIDNRIGVAGVTDPVTGTAYAGTATNWFLTSAPNGRTIVVGYLAGTGRKPQLRNFTLDQGRWGIGWDCKFDIGAKALDFRGMYKSDGA